MDFKTQVIAGSEQRYQEMLSGKTAPTIRTEMNVDTGAAYGTKREAFVRRVEQERKRFNDAITTTKKTYNQNQDAENARRRALATDRSNFKGVIVTTIIYLVLMGAFMFAFLKLDLQNWVTESLLPATGEHISVVIDFESDDLIPKICTIIAGIVGVVMFFVGLSSAGLIGGVLIAGLCAAATMLVARLLVFAFGYLMYFMFQPWCAVVLAVLTCILILIFGSDLGTKRYKARKWIFCLACLAAGVAVMMMVSP